MNIRSLSHDFFLGERRTLREWPIIEPSDAIFFLRALYKRIARV
jgi:hypothetical protein